MVGTGSCSELLFCLKATCLQLEIDFALSVS